MTKLMSALLVRVDLLQAANAMRQLWGAKGGPTNCTCAENAQTWPYEWKRKAFGRVSPAG